MSYLAPPYEVRNSGAPANPGPAGGLKLVPGAEREVTKEQQIEIHRLKRENDQLRSDVQHAQDELVRQSLAFEQRTIQFGSAYEAEVNERTKAKEQEHINTRLVTSHKEEVESLRSTITSLEERVQELEQRELTALTHMDVAREDFVKQYNTLQQHSEDLQHQLEETKKSADPELWNRYLTEAKWAEKTTANQRKADEELARMKELYAQVQPTMLLAEQALEEAETENKALHEQRAALEAAHQSEAEALRGTVRELEAAVQRGSCAVVTQGTQEEVIRQLKDQNAAHLRAADARVEEAKAGAAEEVRAAKELVALMEECGEQQRAELKDAARQNRLLSDQVAALARQLHAQDLAPPSAAAAPAAPAPLPAPAAALPAPALPPPSGDRPPSPARAPEGDSGLVLPDRFRDKPVKAAVEGREVVGAEEAGAAAGAGGGGGVLSARALQEQARASLAAQKEAEAQCESMRAAAAAAAAQVLALEADVRALKEEARRRQEEDTQRSLALRAIERGAAPPPAADTAHVTAGGARAAGGALSAEQAALSAEPAWLQRELRRLLVDHRFQEEKWAAQRRELERELSAVRTAALHSRAARDEAQAEALEARVSS